MGATSQSPFTGTCKATRQPSTSPDRRTDHESTRPPPPASIVVACGALFFALTGTSFADVAQLARNSVGTPQLRNNAVTTPKLRNGAVTTAKLRNRAVTTPKIRNNAVTLAKIAPSARIPGPQGPAGPQGPPGPPAGIADGSITTSKLADAAVTAPKLAVVRRSSSVVVQNNTTGARSAACQQGEKLVGGGTDWGNAAFNDARARGAHVVRSGPSSASERWWLGRGYNGSGAAMTLRVHAFCIAAE